MKVPAEYILYIVTASCVLFGAVVHATAQFKLARDRNDETFTWVDFAILIPLSTFSGGIFGIFASIYFLDQRVIILAASMGAFLGIAGLNKLAVVLLDLGESWLKTVLNSKKND